MAQQDPSDQSEFESLDDLPTRVKEPQWRWWRQPIGIATICALCGAIALVLVLNRARPVLEQPVTLLADIVTSQNDGAILIDFSGVELRFGDLDIPRTLSALKAGDAACLQILSRRFDSTALYRLIDRDDC